MVRDFDHYVQFRSSNKPNMDEYSQPISKNLFNAAEKIILERFDLTIEDGKKLNKAITFDLPIKGVNTSISALYDPRYELWILTETPKDKFYNEFWSTLPPYLSVFILLQIIIYIFFRRVSNAEERKQHALIEQATHDLLTGLPNRNYLLSRSPYWLDDGTKSFCILYIDLDHFKNVNDSLGHACGDKVLREIAARLRKFLPEASDLIRYGGDEFIIITPNTKKNETLKFAEDIVYSLSRPYLVQGVHFNLGASIGVAGYPENGDDLDALLRAADIAMYEAKKLRNCVRFFDKEMQSEYLERMEIEQHLRQAIDQDEIYLMYQPQMDTHGKVVGVETLARWNNRTLGYVPPDRFIPVAESTGLMPSIGLFILETCLSDMEYLKKQTHHNLKLSINISVMQLMQDSFLTQLENALNQITFDRHLVSLEITESLFIEDLETVIPLLEKISAMGIHISMDDFGTGYSSLSLLRKLPVDELKIDKSFIDNILTEDAARNMIKSIIAIGKNYNMNVVAEGVESQKQAVLLKGFGCDSFQGYLYAKPMRLEELKKFFTFQ